MTIQQAIKKYKLEPLSVSAAKVKAKELNVDEVLYMNVQKNKYAYIVRDSRGVMLYTDERNLYTNLSSGITFFTHTTFFVTDIATTYNNIISQYTNMGNRHSLHPHEIIDDSPYFFTKTCTLVSPHQTNYTLCCHLHIS